MLCGRVLLFLAKLLPLTERSGVNLNGAFNTDNATPVEEVAEVGGCKWAGGEGREARHSAVHLPAEPSLSCTCGGCRP